jgi:aspartyl-tRNA(Asn)/glutamyl-tRNA(Gln) amidotransferase subunit A
MEPSQLSAAEIVSQIAGGTLTATECVQHFLSRIDTFDEKLNSFLSIAHESALATAAEIDRKKAAGEKLGPLAGLPIGIKDGICTAGHRTSAASRMLEDFEPPYNATLVQQLLDADAIMIGKTNMDEFAMGSSTENSYFGPCLNPWNHDHVPGGSSGGSAVCVAADLAPVAIGSDTGGSIRQPAAFCGLTGLKPTYGRVSRFGLLAFASSLDQMGPMARSAEDCAMILNVIAGHDQNDSTSAKIPTIDYASELNESITGLRIGICAEHFEEGLDPEIATAVRQSVEVLKDLGAEIVDVHLPHTKYAVPAYYVIAPCEASSNLARYDGVRYTIRAEGEDLEQMFCRTRGEGFGPEVKRRIMLGTYALSSGYYDAYYVKASKVRRLIKQDYDTAFRTADLILGPTTPTTAFRMGEHNKNPLEMYLSDIYTVSSNLSGVPSISLPCGFSSAGLPIGLQLQSRSFAESDLLRTAHQYQQQTDWHSRRPGMQQTS